jgi:hypothetical protein
MKVSRFTPKRTVIMIGGAVSLRSYEAGVLCELVPRTNSVSSAKSNPQLGGESLECIFMVKLTWDGVEVIRSASRSGGDELCVEAPISGSKTLGTPCGANRSGLRA